MAQRPNIVVILVDDMGYSDLNCYGSGTRTPHLDALAAGGLRFTDFYNTPRCCPSRASLLTGLTPHKAGVGWMTFDWRTDFDPDADGYAGTLNRRCLTIPEALKPAGYRSYLSGKWHLTADFVDKETWPPARGFDRSFACIAGGSNYFEPEYLTLDEKFYVAPRPCYLTDLIGDFAVDFVGEHFAAHSEDPFFMYVAFTAPHFPIMAPAAKVEGYRGRFDHGHAAERAARYARMQELGVIREEWGLSPRPDDVPPWESFSDEQKAIESEMMATYAAMVEVMDENVGKLVRALETHGALEDTLILFLSDNGGCAEGGHVADPVSLKVGESWAWVQNTPFQLYKHFTMQGGVQTPFIAHWPAGITRAAGSIVSTSTGSLYDIMPTCLDLAGADYPEERDGEPLHSLDGESLAPLLGNSAPGERRDIFIEHEGNGMLRRGRLKLVRQFGESWQLYDMDHDRSELHDLAANPAYREDFLEMVHSYEEWEQANLVMSGAKMRVGMAVHGYPVQGNRQRRAFLAALADAPDEEIVRG